MSLLNDFLNYRQGIKCVEDQIMYGNSYLMVKERSKYNPLRYLLGRRKEKRIHPKSIFINSFSES